MILAILQAEFRAEIETLKRDGQKAFVRVLRAGRRREETSFF
jgi:hypothetical protein